MKDTKRTTSSFILATQLFVASALLGCLGGPDVDPSDEIDAHGSAVVAECQDCATEPPPPQSLDEEGSESFDDESAAAPEGGGEALDADDKGNKYPPLPPGTVVHRANNGRMSARWLQGHRNNENEFSECISFFLCGNPLSNAKTHEIADLCAMRPTFRQKMECIHDRVRAAVRELEMADGKDDGDYVCRHFASAAHDVAQQIAGLNPNWECSRTHAWVQFDGSDGRRYEMDPYNNILFSFP